MFAKEGKKQIQQLLAIKTSWVWTQRGGGGGMYLQAWILDSIHNTRN